MLSIRLSRVGKKKQPSYRVIVSDSKKDPWDRYLENLGTYNPMTEPKEIKLKADRIKYWLSVGAQASPTVHNILVDQKIIEGEKIRASGSNKKKNKGEGEEEPKDGGATDAKVEVVASAGDPPSEGHSKAVDVEESKDDKNQEPKAEEKKDEAKPEPTKEESKEDKPKEQAWPRTYFLIILICSRFAPSKNMWRVDRNYNIIYITQWSEFIEVQPMGMSA